MIKDVQMQYMYEIAEQDFGIIISIDIKVIAKLKTAYLLLDGRWSGIIGGGRRHGERRSSRRSRSDAENEIVNVPLWGQLSEERGPVGFDGKAGSLHQCGDLVGLKSKERRDWRNRCGGKQNLERERERRIIIRWRWCRRHEESRRRRCKRVHW